MKKRKALLILLVILFFAGPALAQGGAIRYGSTVTGYIANHDDRHTYTFDGTEGDIVYIRVDLTGESTANQIIPHAELSGPDGEVLAESVYGGARLGDAWIIQRLPVSGTYAITFGDLPNHIGQDLSGQYALSLQKVEPQPIFSGAMMTLSPAREGQLFFYAFEGEAGEVIRLFADAEYTAYAADNPDTFIYLMHGDGTLIDYGDDKGGVINDLIFAQLPASGTYLAVTGLTPSEDNRIEPFAFSYGAADVLEAGVWKLAEGLTSLTQANFALVGAQGETVTMSMRPAGDFEANFQPELLICCDESGFAFARTVGKGLIEVSAQLPGAAEGEIDEEEDAEGIEVETIDELITQVVEDSGGWDDPFGRDLSIMVIQSLNIEESELQRLIDEGVIPDDIPIEDLMGDDEAPSTPAEESTPKEAPAPVYVAQITNDDQDTEGDAVVRLIRTGDPAVAAFEDVQKIAYPEPAAFTEGQVIAYGDFGTGEITTAGDPFELTFEGIEGEVALIFMGKTQDFTGLNAKLALLDPDGETVAEDHFHAPWSVSGDPEALVFARLPADGTYTIHATSPDEYVNPTGEFYLGLFGEERLLTAGEAVSVEVESLYDQQAFAVDGAWGRQLTFEVEPGLDDRYGTEEVSPQVSITGPDNVLIGAVMKSVERFTILLPDESIYKLRILVDSSFSGGTVSVRLVEQTEPVGEEDIPLDEIRAAAAAADQAAAEAAAQAAVEAASQESGAEAEAGGSESGDIFCTVIADRNANLRSGPGTAYGKMGLFAAGDRAGVVGRFPLADGSNWWKLDTGAWVHSSVVSADGDCTSAPILEAP